MIYTRLQCGFYNDGLFSRASHGRLKNRFSDLSEDSLSLVE